MRRALVLTCSFALSAAAHADKPDADKPDAEVFDPAALEALVARLPVVEGREGEPDAYPKSLGAGLYTYVLDERTPFARVQWHGSSRWRYEGQEVFDIAAQGLPSWVIAGEGEPLTKEALAARDARQFKVDRLGRRWRWDGRSYTPTERDGLSAEGAEARFQTQPGAEVGPMQRNSWTHTNCDGVGGIDIRRWNADGRMAIPDYNTRREEATVVIQRLGVQAIHNYTEYDWEVTGLCTGTMVAPDVVLTAAHCVATSNYTPWNPDALRVCTNGNETGHDPVCMAVQINTPNTDYLVGTHDVNEDFAVLTLVGDLVDPVNTFDLATAPSSTWTGFSVLSHGYPAERPGCTFNEPTGEIDFDLTGIDTHDGFALGLGPKQVWQSDSFLALGPATVRTRLDGGNGHSGAAFFISNGGENEIIGVWAAWSSVLNRHFGPRLEEFEVLVLDAL
jgi:V8-like Glu-specific endopeptidase